MICTNIICHWRQTEVDYQWRLNFCQHHQRLWTPKYHTTRTQVFCLCDVFSLDDGTFQKLLTSKFVRRLQDQRSCLEFWKKYSSSRIFSTRRKDQNLKSNWLEKESWGTTLCLDLPFLKLLRCVVIYFLGSSIRKFRMKVDRFPRLLKSAPGW